MKTKPRFSASILTPLLTLLLCSLTPREVSAQITLTTLHQFTGVGSDGFTPYAGVTFSNGNLYGTTLTGGSGGYGTIYSVSANGSSAATIYSFPGTTDGLVFPRGEPLVNGSSLYGTLPLGGTGSGGVLYSLPVGGGPLTILHNFGSNDGHDGSYPYTSLILGGSTIYGTTTEGGQFSNGGTVFSMPIGGGPVTILHSFNGGLNEGIEPYGSLLLNGNTLYGTTHDGGSDGMGTVFSVSITGGPLTTLYSFKDNGADGLHPYSGLTLSGNTLYGMTDTGGTDGEGTIFSLSVTGGEESILHSFTGIGSDGSEPSGGLVLSGNTLYGTTILGGTDAYGTIFSLSTVDDSFATIYNFANNEDGANPQARLIVEGDTLYGTTSAHGGTVFALQGAVQAVPEPSTWAMLLGGVLALILGAKRRPGRSTVLIR